MKGISEYLDLHSTALSLRSKRNKVLASNIANAATPHFKARDIDFDAEMRKVQRDGPLRTTNEKHFPVLTKGNGREMLYRQPLAASKDGNTVEIGLEQAKFGRASVEYQATLDFLQGRVASYKRALKGD